ncbi:putative sarcosine oxidase protein [Podospora aff. communis PSN243]|uniref:Sarcosine oxidase protein n=1 Tax=Podospora aff. communis PSN243 TaxID=3040156 RepID=A0AAV9GM65_9PEZI|nr:putative sarcosine oxidase protein [Podospora aff. communis PSN243]
MDATTFAIVGAGVFGLSTAFHLRRMYPAAKIFLIDRTRGDDANRGAATSDFNKIIRADYPDPVYMKIALDAQESWRTDPVFKPYYHECGMLFAEEIGMGRASFKNYRDLGVETQSEILTKEGALARFPIFQDANWSGVNENYFNPQSGWGEADGAVASFFAATCNAGVTFIKANAERLVLDSEGNCTGVFISEGGGQTREFLADRTILCVGAFTEKFLADTAPERSELQVNGRLIAAAAVQCKATYPPEEEEKLSKAPVHFLGMWHTHGESIPPFNGRLKFNCEVSFTNMTYHDGLDKDISIPPPAESQSTWSQNVPEGLKQEVANVVRNTYGSYVPGIDIESYRVCWDAVSPNQDFIIDYHPKCKNLVIASAGSFHSWKFLPNIGEYVVKRVFNTLEEDLVRKWAWDRENTGSACEMYDPSRDMKAIGPFEGWPRTESSESITQPARTQDGEVKDNTYTLWNSRCLIQ